MRTEQEIKAEIEELDSQIKPLASRRAQCSQELLELKSQFKVGDIIAWRGHKGRVIEIRHWCVGEPMWIVQNILKDGKEGRTCQVYSYYGVVKAQ